MRLSLLLTPLFFLQACQEEKKSTKKPPTAAEVAKVEPEEPAKKTLLNVPAGAVISNLNLPYYDKDQKKVSQLIISEVIVTDDQETGGTILEGKDLTLWIFDDQGAIRSSTTMKEANYLLDQEQLVAKGEVLTLGPDRQFAVKSNGGIFSLATGQAILLGPATSRFQFPPKKKP